MDKDDKYPANTTNDGATALATQVGTMSGGYRMVAKGGARFDAFIARLVLSVPRALH